MYGNYKLEILLAIILTFLACVSGQNYDLSTDDGVFDALESITGKEYKKQSRGCLKRPKKLADIILVGGFANDRGCILVGGFVGQKYVERQDLSGSALKKSGWEKAPPNIREELALNWVKSGLLAFGNPLKKATKDFTDQKFEKPRVKMDNNSNVTVTLWIKQPAGMICEDAYNQISYTFSKDGRFQKRKGLKSFRIPCE